MDNLQKLIDEAREMSLQLAEQEQCGIKTELDEDYRLSAFGMHNQIAVWVKNYSNRPNGKRYRIVIVFHEFFGKPKNGVIMLCVGNDVVKSNRKNLERHQLNPHVHAPLGWDESISLTEIERTEKYIFRIPNKYAKA